MRFGLSEEVIQKICIVIHSCPSVEKVILYGSRAKGNHKPGSDIDLSLAGDSITATERDRILIELDDLFLPYSIDLNLLSKINHKELREHIERVGIEFCTC
ncbi:nucleotidyltransferase domain-containing protein [Desulfovibrio sp. JC010]|uniref:nucleotidyltransferase domain-containing protein n=1 Tax=Desulfovibrio sp. JC010 TaxID=2593641 RepID=UPI0013D7BCB4|nr:nucleotidyltransferase domain-containing protein [Desulfovibrio sp. JC010]NDV27427.1 nucleotidyltransferase domain-containing protein [Desulfovibrio sp. JC010]